MRALRRNRKAYWKAILEEAERAAVCASDTPAEEHCPCEVDWPSLEEVCTAVRQLRNNRAPREDGIPVEIYKVCINSLGSWLHRAFCKVWLSETAPNNRNDAVLLPLFKEGSTRICCNYRGVSWIDVAAKVFSVILLKGFQSQEDQRTRPDQSGFRPGRV